MSRYYGTYNQYLGAQRCCDLRGQGPVGPEGPAGRSQIGPRGHTGPQGESFTGPTGRGCRGPTGPSGGPIGATGATGPSGGPIGDTGATGAKGDTGTSFWDASGNSAVKYQGDVYIDGKLNVSGGIDPTYLALTPQVSYPLPSGQYGIWIEDVPAKYLHTNSIYLNNGITLGATGFYYGSVGMSYIFK